MFSDLQMGIFLASNICLGETLQREFWGSNPVFFLLLPPYPKTNQGQLLDSRDSQKKVPPVMFLSFFFLVSSKADKKGFVVTCA